MEHPLLISIIIPAYNAAEHLDASLGNALAQCSGEVEVILVDDASTDATLELAQELAKDSPYATVLSHAENQGPATARSTAIKQARGEYCLFVDADDELSLEAYKVLSKEIRFKPVDILHFPMEFEVRGKIAESTVDHMQRYFTPPNQQLLGWQIAESAFMHYEHSWNLPGKLIRTKLCKQALEMMPKTNVLLGEDLLFYFFIASLAESYRGMASKRFYKYCYGLGGSNRHSIDLDQFTRRFVNTAEITKQIDLAMQGKNKASSYERVLASISNHLLGETMDAIFTLLPPGDRAAGLALVQDAWSASDLISFVGKFAWNDPYWASELLACDQWGSARSNGYNQTACYMPQYCPEQLQAYSQKSREADTHRASILLLEEPLAFSEACPSDFHLLSVAPRLPYTTAASYKSRARVLEEYVAHHQIGQVILLEYYDRLFFWDVALLSLLGVTVVDSKGKELKDTLSSPELLKKALRKGRSGEWQSKLAASNFAREHLGHEFALRSYRLQALPTRQKFFSKHPQLKKVLTRPYRFLIGILGKP
ncbi:MAG: glycosyltransferase [Coriobacteriia bacterium]|nr:glycosyltransferase [Coriobacteriia bacterium]